ncbi:MAG: metal-dependent transcriptional regulator [Clostridia bacterium]|nr:metal-dependent transcriptional regulator [Clostridia bacterium]MBR0026943.1 metal-dependent transcriptional regulator [Clostridia bacterium]
MKIHESAENYLEAILMIGQRKPEVRSIDIANELGFSKPSVSYAMKQFRENGYIVMAPDGIITLTDAGREVAERTFERHTVLTKMLIALGVSEETAREDACRMEHHISEETFDAIKAHAKKFL